MGREQPYKTKPQLAREEGKDSYLSGFDDEHVYLMLKGEQYAHPNSLGGRGKTLPKEYWDKLDKLAIELAEEFLEKHIS